jgi:hypothetical protein
MWTLSPEIHILLEARIEIARWPTTRPSETLTVMQGQSTVAFGWRCLMPPLTTAVCTLYLRDVMRDTMGQAIAFRRLSRCHYNTRTL